MHGTVTLHSKSRQINNGVNKFVFEFLINLANIRLRFAACEKVAAAIIK